MPPPHTPTQEWFCGNGASERSSVMHLAADDKRTDSSWLPVPPGYGRDGDLCHVSVKRTKPCSELVTMVYTTLGHSMYPIMHGEAVYNQCFLTKQCTSSSFAVANKNDKIREVCMFSDKTPISLPVPVHCLCHTSVISSAHQHTPISQG